MAKKPEVNNNIVFPRNWKSLSKQEQEIWINENCTLKPRITTEVKHRKKPHDKFRGKFQFDSTPTELTVTADQTDVKIQDLTPNPYKHSFGKAITPHGVAEACIYLDRNNLQKMPKSVLWFFKKDDFAKGNGFVCDLRRTKEYMSLRMKTYYFLSLSAERKREYLLKKGVFANINILGNNNNEAEN